MKPRFNIAAFLAFASLVALSRSSANAEDWPLVRGDTFGSGVAHSALSDDLDVLWKYSAGKDAGFDATAIVAEGIVYIGDSAGIFHAIRLADHSVVWTKQFPDSGFSAGAAYEKGRIYVGDVNGIARCLSASDGSEIWK